MEEGAAGEMVVAAAARIIHGASEGRSAVVTAL